MSTAGDLTGIIMGSTRLAGEHEMGDLAELGGRSGTGVEVEEVDLLGAPSQSMTKPSSGLLMGLCIGLSMGLRGSNRGLGSGRGVYTGDLLFSLLA